MLDDDGLALVLHDQNVLQADAIALVIDDAHDLAAARQLALHRVVVGVEADVLAHVEVDAELAGLGQDRLAVLLERAGGGRDARSGRRLGQGSRGRGGAGQKGGGEEDGAHGAVPG
ncbi:hypothetical protein D3C85_1387800 [compost metagenome]